MSSPGFELNPKGAAASVANHYTEWVTRAELISSHQRVNEGDGEFSERTLDVEVDDPGLKKERRERWPSRDPPPVVHERDAEVDDPGLSEKRETRTVAE
ncbi:hypothetical protein TNCV_2048701 [Trichonephila clavipes]|nr:hypothetical protein TNCV_2048701 [Trichonephila clavipes]